MHDITLYTFDQLRATGLTSGAVKIMVRDGRLRRVRRGHYALHTPDDAAHQHVQLLEATQRACAADNVISHTSAALLHGLPIRDSALEQVTMTRVSPGHGDRKPWLFVRATTITEDEVEQLEGMRVTTKLRTVGDVVRTESFAWGVAAADAALRQGMDRDELVDAVLRHPRLHGVRKGLHALRFADARAESPLESVSRVNMVLAGVPTPTLQPRFYDENGDYVARTDFYWEEYGVVGESDGYGKYTTLLAPGQTVEDVLRAEKAREARLRALGLFPVRWDWDTGISPDRIANLLLPILEQHRKGIE
ncbi:hypothetical protein [uncultured Tessaracoccus sp.]|uniref:hypothetical protein n=1 Tax=uncultured Tessaracoccus sp. TaxID=905023 RepID=UPI0025D94F8F|nr:hypothetical protein [uncultured Tessaracoccus sp.]